ncbi:BRISC and BRCA1-A complex member 2, partial [Mucuna pruriens]
MAVGLENVPPFIAAQLTHLLSHFRLTLKATNPSLSLNKCGPLTNTTPLPSIASPSSFLSASTSSRDVIYNADSPTAAPDVIFGPEDEDFHPFLIHPSAQPNNCLSDWNHKDPARLLTLIQFLRDQYVLYQRKRVGEVDDDRLKFEISTILSREGIEMHTSSGAEKSEEVKFAVPLLDMNINKMVSCCPWRYSQKIYLQVVYPVGRKYMSAQSAPRLKLVSSPELKALFSIDDVKLLPWLDGMCLAEYLPNLEEYLGKQVLEAVSLIEVRRNFIEALACPMGRPVEADPVFCRKATFLSASGVFTFLVHILIPTQFPKQQPAIMLQSSQHFNSQMAPMKSRLMSDYPWSPRWEPLQMTEHEALNFKRQCSEGLGNL